MQNKSVITCLGHLFCRSLYTDIISGPLTNRPADSLLPSTPFGMNRRAMDSPNGLTTGADDRGRHFVGSNNWWSSHLLQENRPGVFLEALLSANSFLELFPFG
ncbi:hypothetical protein CEXT_630811 [Caerostris extrusa]|uniref:Uncharacterized protein n=1 Tax=Caerostris extrusa TaxID=172846 RepID=A0AAV4VJ85_CAEEX|nr:hypothetical protein CEXT_630811 [Caerostris extrusa]